MVGFGLEHQDSKGFGIHFWVEEMSLNQLEQAIPPSPRHQKLRTFVGDNSKAFIILLIKQNNKHGHVRSGFPGFKKFFSPQDFYLQPQFWTKK